MISTNPNKANLMKIKVNLLIVIIIGIGIYLLGERTSENKLESNSDNKHAEAKVNSRSSDELLPVINFPLLGKARPIDLIDMTLSFPESIKKLDGRRVSLIGFMAPFDSLDDMSRCMIVPSYVGCTFCSPPNLRQVVFISQGEKDPSANETYSFIEDPSYVTGIFRISHPKSEHEGKKQGFVYSLENAKVIAHKGDVPKRAPSHATPGGHNNGQNVLPLPPISANDLISKVIELLGFEAFHPITIERVPAETFGNLIRNELEAVFPKENYRGRVQAFSLLGFIPENADWLKILTGFETGQRAAISAKKGASIYVLDSVPIDHPYVRIELVGATADALIRQRIMKNITNNKSNLNKSEDLRRASEALRMGIRKTVTDRYAASMSISKSIPPPSEFMTQVRIGENTSRLQRWHSLPEFIGNFFVDFIIGPNGSLESMKSILKQPPSTTMEFVRPRWYKNDSFWRHNPISINFANKLMETPPNLTDVLGVGGLVPWLAQSNSSYTARKISGKWTGDRWALWQFSDGSAFMLLETNWQDETAALEFSAAVPKHPYQWFFPHKEGSSTVRLIRGSSSSALNRLDSLAQ